MYTICKAFSLQEKFNNLLEMKSLVEKNKEHLHRTTCTQEMVCGKDRLKENKDFSTATNRHCLISWATSIE